MKWNNVLTVSAILLLIITLTSGCKNVTGALDDQTPLLIVNVETVGAITIDDTNKVYIIYYTDNDWTDPWLSHGSSTNTIFNPIVGTLSTYIAVFWDANGNGVVDTGEPCTGYENADHSAGDPLTPLDFIPLQWRAVTITLDATITY